jgi:hypothetical protein
MAQREILTIGEAEAALSLSGPRIHQLLADGELDGPALPPGRKRHSPGAPRVTQASIDQYLRTRADEQALKPAARPPKKGKPAPPASGSSTGEASAKAAAQEMKVKLDAMREELAAERARNKDLLEVVDKLIGLLRGAQASADRLDGVTDGYSEALTQLLTPDAPG